MFRIVFLLLFCFSYLFSADKVSVQLLWLDQFQFAGYYMAKEKGFYKNANLDVDIKKYSSRFGSTKHSIVNDVLDGKSTYGIGRSNLIVEKSEGKDIVALAAIYQSSPLILLALESSNIGSLKDLKEKRIMLTNSTIGTTSLRAMLVSQGLDLDSSKILKHTFNLDDLIDGKTDLMGSYVSNEPFRLDQKGIKYKIFSPKDEGYDFYSDILFTSQKELTENPKRVERFLNATLKGWEYAFNNIDETVNLIYEKYNSQNKTKDALFFEALKLKELAYYNTSKIGEINIKKIQRIYDIYRIMGKVKNNIDFSDFLYSFAKLSLTPVEKKFIQNFRKLKVHNEKSWPPYNYNEFGLPKGFSVDYMNLLAQKIGFEIEYVSNYTWNEYLEMIKHKRIDVMLNIVNTPNRREFINFTTSYAQSLPSIYTLNNRSDIKSLADLKGKRVSVPKGFYTSEVIRRKYPDIKLIESKDMLKSLEDVAFKRADATISDFAVANYLLKRHGIINLKAISNIPDKDFVSKLNLGIRNDLPILKSILQKGMQNIKDEELFVLREKWFGKEHNMLSKDIFFTSKEKEYLHQEKDIKVCIDPKWAPYEYMQDNQHLGITSDYMNHFSHIMNLNFDLVPTTSFYESLVYIRQRKCDILPAAAITLDRLDYINFTKPYLFSNFVLVTKKLKLNIDSLNDVMDEKIGFVRGYASLDIFKKKYPNLKVREYSSILEGLKAVNSGEIYGFIDISSTISSVIMEEDFHNLKMALKLKERLELSIAVRNDDSTLLSIFQKLVTSLSQKEKDMIYRKWITIKYEQEIDYALLWSIFLPIILSLGIIIFYLWNIKLKREIRSKEILEKKLKTSIADFTVLVNSTIEAIFIIEKSGRCIEANDEARKLFKFTKKADYIGKHIYFIIANSDKESVRKRVKNHKSFPSEINFVRKDGSEFPGLVKGENVRRVDQTIRIVSIVDLTELKQKEHLLFQQSKMALMGEMMSAIAHQWRQPLNALAALNMQVETKLEFNDVMTYDEYSPICENINKQLNYMSKTIDDFRDFFIPSKTKIEFNICQIIKDVHEILRPQLENNNIVFTFTCEKVFFYGFPNEFKQVIINILNNAKDAIIINKIKDGEISVEVKKTKDNIVIYLKDNGGGIDKAIINKVFNPYFTTKFESKGTGIGLYMSKMIIEKSMSGMLNVESNDGKTIFTIKL